MRLTDDITFRYYTAAVRYNIIASFNRVGGMIMNGHGRFGDGGEVGIHNQIRLQQ